MPTLRQHRQRNTQLVRAFGQRNGRFATRRCYELPRQNDVHDELHAAAGRITTATSCESGGSLIAWDLDRRSGRGAKLPCGASRKVALPAPAEFEAEDIPIQVILSHADAAADAELFLSAVTALVANPAQARTDIQDTDCVDLVITQRGRAGAAPGNVSRPSTNVQASSSSVGISA